MYPPDLIYGTAFAFEKSALLTEAALESGFRAIDTAGSKGAYREELVGNGIKASSIPREDLYIQTKFSPYKESKDPGLYPYDVKADIATQIEQSIKASLQNLRTTYIDCLILHSVAKDTEDIWREMTKFTPHPVMSLGISNTDLETLNMVCQIAKPASVQNRLTQDTKVNPESPPGVHYPDSPYDREVRNYCQANGIKYNPWGVLWSNPQLMREMPETGVGKEIVFYACLRSLGATILSGTKQIARMKETIDGLNRMEVYAEEHPNEWSTHVEITKKILGWH